MKAAIREFAEKDAKDAAAIWNSIVDEGEAFPQMERLSETEARPDSPDSCGAKTTVLLTRVRRDSRRKNRRSSGARIAVLLARVL